ncbi:MAG: fibrobacter succinogenes major paralogous domain-containing protein [Bacteroidales bacterium]|nr:fibrobacter succinogenes major paralogous domain-containing protein [Bacteroidales bacterium]
MRTHWTYIFVLTILLLSLQSCRKGPGVPTVTTQDVTDIEYVTAASGGNITDDGGDPIIARGICWNTKGNPTTADNVAKGGSGRGPFHKDITNLIPGTTYYLRAYASNSAETGYGNEVTFKTRMIFKPDVSTYCISFENQTTIKTGGYITAFYGGTISERGICWSTSPEPEINSEKKVTDNLDGQNFYLSSSGFIPGTTYYLRAFATDEAGTGYGNEIKFTVHVDGATVSDVDENVYKTTKIGTQTWMAENLKTTKFNDKTPLVNITNDYQDSRLSVYAWYNNKEEYKEEYGALYNYNAVSKAWAPYDRNVCPTGWHVPSDKEWSTLITFLGGDRFAGGKLKETGTTHWSGPNAEATDEFGFRALPGGTTNFCYGFNSVGITGSWWCSDFGIYNKEYYNIVYVMDAYSGSAIRLPGNAHNGYSVRCIRDY